MMTSKLARYQLLLVATLAFMVLLPSVSMAQIELAASEKEESRGVGSTIGNFFLDSVRNKEKEKTTSPQSTKKTQNQGLLGKKNPSSASSDDSVKKTSHPTLTVNQETEYLDRLELLPPLTAPLPVKRRAQAYRTQLLPPSISKIEYSKDNQHLPVVRFRRDYVGYLFEAVEAENTGVMKAFIQRLGSLEVRDHNGNTPLLYAVMSGKVKSLIVLLGMGANPDVINHAGLSPLHAAAMNGQAEMVEMLLASDSSLNIRGDKDRTPLMVAVARRDAQLVNTLLEYGASVDARMLDGSTALHIAAGAAAKTSAYMLIMNGARVDARNFYSHTPLMLAAKRGDGEIVTMLLNAGSDPTLNDINGKNASDYALNAGHRALGEMIASDIIRQKLMRESASSRP